MGAGREGRGGSVPRPGWLQSPEPQSPRTPEPQARADPPGWMCTWCLHPLVVVRVHAHLILLHVEGELTQLHGPQLVVAVQVWPSPQAAVDDMREPLAMGHLQATIQGPARAGRVEKGCWKLPEALLVMCSQLGPPALLLAAEVPS